MPASPINTRRMPLAKVERHPGTPLPSLLTGTVMNRDPILFRVDGTVQGGFERLSRCLAFAAALQRRRRPTYFLSQLEPRSLGLAIKRAGSDWLEADGPAGSPEDLAETIQEVRRLRPAAVIVDTPAASEEYLSEL